MSESASGGGLGEGDGFDDGETAVAPTFAELATSSANGSSESATTGEAAEVA